MQLQLDLVPDRDAVKARFDVAVVLGQLTHEHVCDRESQLLRAEGYAAALQRIFSVAESIDQKTMTLQYFETLKEMGTSPATKFIFPMEFTSLLENFTGKKE